MIKQIINLGVNLPVPGRMFQLMRLNHPISRHLGVDQGTDRVSSVEARMDQPSAPGQLRLPLHNLKEKN